MTSPAPIVLIAPAMAIGSRYYRPLIEEFQSHGWSAKALTRRGFEKGEPEASRRNDWSYADEINDIAEGVAAARAQDPDRPVLLLGHSLGGQLALGHQLTKDPADGLIAVAASTPHFRSYGRDAPSMIVMAAAVVPISTTVAGYLPRPLFGAPGARTLMREWARFVLTGKAPFPVARRISTPTLALGLYADSLAPRSAVVAYVRDYFAPGAATRKELTDPRDPAAPVDHITWVRDSGFVVAQIVAWWDEQSRAAAA
ncbi:alpha/beta fold hydrolase [Dermacoccaceae bacterium W4C1]